MSDETPVVHSGAHQAKPACGDVLTPVGDGSRDGDVPAGASGAPLVRTKLHQAPPSPAVPDLFSDALLTDARLDELRRLSEAANAADAAYRAVHRAVDKERPPHEARAWRQAANAASDAEDALLRVIRPVLPALLDEVTRLRAARREPPPCIPCGKPTIPTCDDCNAQMRTSTDELEQALGIQATGLNYRVKERDGGWRVEVMNSVVGASAPTREGALDYLRKRPLVTVYRLAADMRAPACDDCNDVRRRAEKYRAARAIGAFERPAAPEKETP